MSAKAPITSLFPVAHCARAQCTTRKGNPNVVAGGGQAGNASAAEVQDNGVEMVAMQAVLLQKIEELTLHLIGMKKANDALQARVLTLEHQFRTTHE